MLFYIIESWLLKKQRKTVNFSYIVDRKVEYWYNIKSRNNQDEYPLTGILYMGVLKDMNITVIGCGRWGSFIAWYFSRKEYSVMVYGREESRSYHTLKSSRSNEYLTLPDSVKFTSDIKEALGHSEKIIISVGTQQFPELMEEIKAALGGNGGKTYILCMKGLIVDSGKRLSEVVYDVMGKDTDCVIWVGPGHAQDFCKGIPNCMLIASENEKLARSLCEDFMSDLIRFYYSSDMIGCEVGAASKNVIGIAAGILDGMGFLSLKGALIARGPREIARLVNAMGGNERSIFGLCHIGDYEATLFSLHSHNRACGEALVNNKGYDKLAEGVYTVKSLMVLRDKYGVDMPICESVYNILYKGHNPKDEMEILFLREQKSEY